MTWLLFGLLSGSVPSAALAEAPLSIEGDATPWERVDRRLEAEADGRRGFYLEGAAALGIGAWPSRSDDGTAGPGPGLAFGLGYRFSPLFALGLALQVHALDPGGTRRACVGGDSSPCRVENASGDWSAMGVVGRFHFTREGWFDPWAGFIAGPVWASARADLRTTEPGGAGTVESIRNELRGAGLGLEVGAAFALGARISLALAVRWAHVEWAAGCSEAGEDPPCEDGVPARSAPLAGGDLPDPWTVHLGVRGMP